MVIDDLKFKPWKWPSHRTHLTAGIHQETGGIDHAKPLDEPEVEPLFKRAPGVRRTSRGEDHPDGIVSIIRSLRLFQQDRDHGAERIELYGVVLPALVPVPGGGEALAQSKFVVEHDRAQRRNTQCVTMEERQGSIDGFAGTHTSWLPELHDIGRINAPVDNALWGASSPGGVEDVIRRGFGKRADGRPTTTSLEPFLNGNSVAFHGRYNPANNHQTHMGDVLLDGNEMLHQHIVYDDGSCT